MSLLAVAVLGPDRPGVVAALTEVLLADGGNLEDASMTLLSGQFAMTLVVDVPAGVEEVRADLAPVAGRLDLLVTVRSASAHPAAAQASPPDGVVMPCILRVRGADRPGLVHRMTALLAEHGANITDLATRLVGEAGTPGYVMIVSCDLPANAPAERLVAGVSALAAELGVEATLTPVDTDLL